MLVKSFKPSRAPVLASVVAEMAKPRVVESAKRAGDKLADSRDRSINLPAKETPVLTWARREDSDPISPP
jgi:hypothetical protein